MEFQILGPLEVRRGGERLTLGRAKQRALLGILLVHANELLSSDRLIEELWPEPPETAANTLQVYVARLRKVLEPSRSRGAPGELLVTRPPGYALRVDADELDADRFERLLGEGRTAREADDPATARGKLRDALGLWRGAALADFPYDPFAQTEIARLEDLRLDAAEERIETELALGGAAELVPELEALVNDNPLRERLRGQLMLALYRSGRQAEALEVYRQTVKTFDEELGLAPSPSLQRLQTAILRQEPALEVWTEAPRQPIEAIRTSESGPFVAVEAPAPARKTVTALIARRPSLRLDPEALGREDERFRAELAAIVERYGGTIASTMGGEVMAVFGVPRVHEDDALRALGAAIEIRETCAADATGPGFAVRTGIATGEVLASGSNDRPLSVVGDPVAAARDFVDDAAPGEILVDRETEQLVRDRAELEAAGSDAAPAWRLRNLTRERAVVGSLTTPLVGRTAELALLQHAFDEATRTRTLHLFTVLGDAGIGKSRLAQEFVTRISDEAATLVGRSVPYGEGITFWSLREIVGQLVGAEAADRPAERGEVRALADRLRAAIGGSAASLDREEIFWATRRLFATLARERPLVVFFEDLHWAERTFLDLIEYLAERKEEGTPTLLVCIARPELLDQRQAWAGDNENTTMLVLEGLPDRECEALVGELAPGLPQLTKLRVLEAAGGNPLFIEQLVAMLREHGGQEAELAVPPTINALLSARLDRLGPAERAILARAAVVGKEFSIEAIVHMLPDDARPFAARHTAALVQKGFIEPAPSLGGRGIRFRHILIQQAAYRAAPKALRANLHERFVAWVEDRNRDDAAEPSEIAGYHLEQAFRLRADVGPVGDEELRLAQRASDRLAAAGERAFQQGDMPASVNLLGRAAALPAPPGTSGPAVLPELGYALFEIGEVDEASAVLAEAQARARAGGDRGLEWRVAATSPRIEMYRAPERIDLDALTAQTETAIEALGELGDEAGLARAWMVLSDIHWSNGRLRETSEAATRGAGYARRAGNRREVGWALGQNALCAIHGPMPVTDGLRWLERLLRAEPENRTLDANLTGFVTLLEAMAGRFDEARRHIDDSRALARDLGLIWQAGVQELLSGYIELLAGDPVAAERDMRTAEATFMEVGEGWFLSTVAVDLPRAVYEQGRYDDAFELLTTIEERSAPTDREWQIKRTGIPARLLARRGDFEGAERLAREGVALAAASDFVVLHADVLLDLADVLQLAGRRADAAAATAKAVALYQRKGNVAAARRARTGVTGEPH